MGESKAQEQDRRNVRKRRTHAKMTASTASAESSVNTTPSVVNRATSHPAFNAIFSSIMSSAQPTSTTVSSLCQLHIRRHWN